MAEHDLGDPVTISAEFKFNDELTDPDTARLRLRDPAGEITVFVYGEEPEEGEIELEEGEIGILSTTVTPETPGVWRYHWRSTGDAQGGEPGQFYIRTEFTSILRPTVAEVAAVLRARTKDDVGNEVGTFVNESAPDADDATRPTADQVEELISEAVSDVVTRTGESIPEELMQGAKDAIKTGAAMLVEASFLPEQTNDERTVYGSLRSIYSQKLNHLVAAVQIRDMFGEG